MSPTIFYRDAKKKNNSRLYAQNPAFVNVHKESVKVYPHMYNGNVQQDPLCAEQHPVSQRIFPSLPGCRLRCFIAGQIQHSLYRVLDSF